MRFVASWSMEPYLQGKSGAWESTEHMLAAMVMCIDNVKKFYGRNLILYTDSITEHVLSRLTDNVDIKNVYDDVFKEHNIPLSFWCYPKLLTFRQQTDPYVHIDLDLIIKRKMPEHWFEHDLLVQSTEDLEWMERFSEGHCSQYLYNRDAVKHLYRWDEWWDKPEHSYKYAYNVSIMGFNDMEFNKQYCDLMFEFIEDNSDAMMHYGDTDRKIVPVIIEQQPLFHLAQELKKDVHVTTGFSHDKPPINRVYTHFVGDMMKSAPVDFAVKQRKYLIGPRIDGTIQEMASFIDEKRI